MKATHKNKTQNNKPYETEMFGFRLQNEASRLQDYFKTVAFNWCTMPH